MGAGDQNVLEITAIQPPGKKMMNAADWARGQQELMEQRPQFDAAQSGQEEDH